MTGPRRASEESTTHGLEMPERHGYFLRMHRLILFIFILALAVAPWPTATSAAERATPKLIGTFKDWDAFRYTERGQPVCFVLGRPKSSKAYRNGKRVRKIRRGEVYALVTHRPAAKAHNVVSITTGYDYRKGSTVDVKIGKRRFEMFTAGDTAWARDEVDGELVKAMRKGREMLVTGVSGRGTETRDRYSLLGFTAAHKAITDACK